MVIQRGQAWGTPGMLGERDPVAHDDSELRHVVTAARQSGRPVGRIGLLGGDLCRTVGGPGQATRLHQGGSVLPIDVGRVEIDGVVHWFCAHLVARRAWWIGRVAVVMNAQWLGPYRLGPRAHPNDGLLDLTDGTLPIGQRFEARRRARSGSHVPHPALQVARRDGFELRFDRPVGIWLDGERVARRARHLLVQVESDAGEVVV
jgi:hypothetical protein